MKITAHQLAVATGASDDRAGKWLDALTDAMQAFNIDNPPRVAMFLAQIGHESGGLRWVRELWGPTQAQLGYEGRRDLGNVQPGDGKRYMGRGLVQVTGRANYAAVGISLRATYGPAVPDFEATPAALEEPLWAARSACWFWSSRHLNILADAGDILTVTKRINGGTNGLAERTALWSAAKGVLA